VQLTRRGGTQGRGSKKVEFIPDRFYFFRILHILDVLFGMNGGQERRDVSLSGGGAATAL
jgi:hypothetical protein